MKDGEDEIVSNDEDKAMQDDNKSKHGLYRNPTGHDHNIYNWLDGEWYADVFFNSTMSTEGHTCALVIYSGERCWTKPPLSKSDVGIAACIFSPHIGVMRHLTTDGAPEFIGKKCEFCKWFQGHGVIMKHTC